MKAGAPLADLDRRRRVDRSDAFGERCESARLVAHRDGAFDEGLGDGAHRFMTASARLLPTMGTFATVSATFSNEPIIGTGIPFFIFETQVWGFCRPRQPSSLPASADPSSRPRPSPACPGERGHLRHLCLLLMAAFCQRQHPSQEKPSWESARANQSTISALGLDSLCLAVTNRISEHALIAQRRTGRSHLSARSAELAVARPRLASPALCTAPPWCGQNGGKISPHMPPLLPPETPRLSRS